MRLRHACLWMLWVALPLAAATGASAQRPRYRVDPITDTVVTTVALFSGLGSEMTIRSGELRASTPGPIANIPFYDRWVAEGSPGGSGDVLSNIGMALALAYGVVDSIRTGVDYGADEGLKDALMYSQSALVNWTLVNIIKLTVRRPRPAAYAMAAQEDDPELAEEDTNRELSFYSGHAAVTAGMAGTAAYLAFAEAGHSAHAWTVFAVGTALTAFVGINRVRLRAHFPSDVLVGALVGASVGIMVPHLHRMAGSSQPVSVGVATDGLRGAYGSFTLNF